MLATVNQRNFMVGLPRLAANFSAAPALASSVEFHKHAQLDAIRYALVGMLADPFWDATGH